MCELFGFSSVRETDLRPYLKEFFSHSDVHRHGWGYARIHGNEVELVREGIRAIDSRILPGLVEQTGAEKTFLAHIRWATIGTVSEENCHPFTQKDEAGFSWTMIHNGTIFEGERLLPYLSTQKGGTDSERIFLYLMDKINGEIKRTGHEPHSFRRFKLVEQMIDELAERNKLNLIISDGKYLYIHTNMKGTLYYKSSEEGLMVATVPLVGGNWQPVPMTTLLVFENARLKFRGRNHHHVYTEAISMLGDDTHYNI